MGKEVKMVDAGPGDDIGAHVRKCLTRLKDEKGVLIAVCTPDYGEMTENFFSTYGELKFAVDNGVRILPLKVDEVYPPKPPCGPGHNFDEEGKARELITFAFSPALGFLDCKNRPEDEIAEKIALQLTRSERKLTSPRPSWPDEASGLIDAPRLNANSSAAASMPGSGERPEGAYVTVD